MSTPPPLPPKTTPIITWVYLGVIILCTAFNAVMVYRTAISKPHANEPYIIGMIVGGAFLPLGLVAGIACCWPKNRNFQSIVNILFWVALIATFSKLNQIFTTHKF